MQQRQPKVEPVSTSAAILDIGRSREAGGLAENDGTCYSIIIVRLELRACCCYICHRFSVKFWSTKQIGMRPLFISMLPIVTKADVMHIPLR